MTRHLLLEKIHIYEKNTDKKLETNGLIYSNGRGYWLDYNTSTPLVLNPKRPLPTSKKHDVERGEDRK